MTLRKSKRSHRLTRGQALVEYSIIAHAMLIGSSLMLLPMVSRLLEALSAYYESIYFVLRTGAV